LTQQVLTEAAGCWAGFFHDRSSFRPSNSFHAVERVFYVRGDGVLQLGMERDQA